MRNENVLVSLILIKSMFFVSLKPRKPPQVVMMMSSVSAVMEAYGAGSLEMILGWNMQNGFLGKFSDDSLIWCLNVMSRALVLEEKSLPLIVYLHFQRMVCMNVCIFVPLVICRCEYLLQEKGQEFVHQIQARFPRLFEQVS